MSYAIDYCPTGTVASWEELSHIGTGTSFEDLDVYKNASPQGRDSADRRELTQLTHEEWASHNPWQITGGLMPQGKPQPAQEFSTIEPLIDENKVANDRSTLFYRNPYLLKNPERASKEISARLQILETRLSKMVPVRSDNEMAELEKFVGAIEELSQTLR